MTRDEAIKQLDWYFDIDDGIAAEDKTRKAYEILRAFYMENKPPEKLFSDTITCPVCRDKAE